jgi:hypothetical protein
MCNFFKAKTAMENQYANGKLRSGLEFGKSNSGGTFAQNSEYKINLTY